MAEEGEDGGGFNFQVVNGGGEQGVCLCALVAGGGIIVICSQPCHIWNYIFGDSYYKNSGF